jgi:two-component system response regulator HydG
VLFVIEHFLLGSAARLGYNREKMESADMAERYGSVLVVDDNEDVLTAARIFLKYHVAAVETLSDPERLPDLLDRERFDVILLDMNFHKDVTSGEEGFHWLHRIRQIDPSVIVIFITAYADIEMAVRAIKEGATDFIVKPWQNEKLLATVSSALALSRSRREVDSLRSRERRLSEDLDQPFHDFIGESPPMQEVYQAIRKVAATDANVLITGENGTGKELVARAIHRQSPRAQAPFVKVDMGALSGSLFESELFGHVKGAFTDAREDRPGRFEIASGGTLFLDEIGNLPLGLQTKLLSVLQSRQVTRVGSNTPRPFDIRLICATNLLLMEMVEEGTFRQDLLYRINTVNIEIPPLRERTEDIPRLAEHFLSIYAKKYRKEGMRTGAATMKKLEAYHWPGNVRELQHAVERAVIMSSSDVLKPDDFLFAPASRKGDEVLIDSLNLDDAEQAVIEAAMRRYGGNISRVARELGLSRAALYRRLEKYDL